MTRRFDRDVVEGKTIKHHVQTLCAMDHLDFNQRATHAYAQLFMMIARLKLDDAALDQAFRRMAFNVMARNCDDHTKNFAFRLKQGAKWELAPAYDMTHAYNPKGEWTYQHLMSVNGKFKDITRDDLLVEADRFGVSGPNAILDTVRAALEKWHQFAVQAEPLGTANAVAASEAVVGQRPFVMINSDNYYPLAAFCGLRDAPGPAVAIFDQETLVAESNIPAERISKFAVVEGIAEADGFVRLKRIIEKPDEATQIEVRVADPDAVGQVRRAIYTALVGTPVSVIDWTQSNNSFFAAVTVEQNVMFLILTLIILVAAFNVVSSLIMMVKDKTRDIAVLRTLGAGRGAVMRIFLMCGAFVGVTGTLIGTAIGIVFCRNIVAIQRQSLSPFTFYTTSPPVASSAAERGIRCAGTRPGRKSPPIPETCKHRRGPAS